MCLFEVDKRDIHLSLTTLSPTNKVIIDSMIHFAQWKAIVFLNSLLLQPLDSMLNPI